MRRSRNALFTLSALVLIGLSISLPAVARTGAMMNANSDAAECPDVVAAVDDEAAGGATVSKPGAAKRGAAPTQTRARPGTRDANAGAAVRGPRWHRFLPGMFR